MSIEVTRPKRLRIPRPLRIERTPLRALLAADVASGVLLILGFLFGVPLWMKVLWFLIPWAPVAAYEIAWKHRFYGAFAVFLAVAVLQVGHLGEHSAQVFELLRSHGNLASSHGIFGQLDLEGVHFGWDSAVWLGIGILVSLFGRNAWLWVSWAFASIHEVEHLYLIWMAKMHYGFWARGGIFGIMGRGGLIGSPLYRPYLHFLYNFMVVLPLLLALWDQARATPDRALIRALPELPSAALAELTEMLDRLHLRGGEIVALGTGGQQPVYLVARGEVELLQAQPSGTAPALGPGRWVPSGDKDPPVIALRAVRPAEILAIGRPDLQQARAAGQAARSLPPGTLGDLPTWRQESDSSNAG